MTTVAISRNSSPFAGPGSVVLSCRGSTFTTDHIRDARIEWFVYKDGVLVDSHFKAGGSPEFGLAVEPGDYVVFCRIMAPEDSGSYAIASEEWTVTAPSYQTECWFDPNAGSNGDGASSSTPFNDIASVSSHLLLNHVDGATNQSALHIKAGSTWSGAAFLLWTLEDMQGRLVVDKYDAGANPSLTMTADESAFSMPVNMGIWTQDIDVTGNYVYGSTAGDSAAIDSYYSVDGTHTTGLNVGVLRCNFANFSGYGVFNHTSGTPGADSVTNGGSDHFLVHDSTITDTGAGSVNGEQARYATVRNCTFGRCWSNHGFRFAGGAHTSIIRDSVFEPVNASALSIFTISAAASTIISGLSIIGCDFQNKYPNLVGNLASTPASTVRHLRDVHFSGNIVDNRANVNNGTMGMAVAYECVMRQNWFYSDLPRFITTNTKTVGAVDGGAVELTDGSNWTFDGNTCYVTRASNGATYLEFPTWYASGFRMRNNFFPWLTSGQDPEILGGGNRAAATLIAECDYNVRFCADASAPWAVGFTDVGSTGGRSLADWQANTSFDANSIDNSAGVLNLVDTASSPPDLGLAAGSGAIDTVGTFPWHEVDIHGHLRTGTYDAGAMEFGATTEPTPPPLGGGEDVTPAAISADHSTVDPTVVLGPVSVTPAPAVAEHGTVAPSVQLGATSVTPAPAISYHDTVAPGVTLGGVTIFPVPAVAEHSTIDPSVSTSAATTQVVIARHSSPFDGPGSVVLDCRGSIFQTGQLEDSRIEWHAFKDGVHIDSLVLGGGCPEYGLAVEPGAYTVFCRIVGPGDGGSYAIASVEWTVAAPTYTAECWFDPNAGSNGDGTSPASPYNSIATASAYLLGAHVNGPTNQCALHIKAGSTWSGTSFLPWNPGTMQGRLVVDTYDVGANPSLTMTVGASCITTPPNMGVWVQDIDIVGPYVYGVGDPTGGSYAGIDNFFYVDGTHTTGLNTGVLRCNISGFNGHAVFNHSIGTEVDDVVTNGCCDHYLVHDCVVTDTGNGALFGEMARYATVKGVTLGRNWLENNCRFSGGTPSSIFRECIFEPINTPGANSNFRLHAAKRTVVLNVSIIGCDFQERDPQITSYWDPTPTSNVRYLANVWFVGNRVDNRDNQSNGTVAWETPYNGVIRNNQFFSELPRFWTTRSRAIGSLDASATLITDGANLWFDGNTCYASTTGFFANSYLNVPSWLVSGLRVRNNLFVFMATNGDPKLIDGGGRAAATLITECNHNVYFPADASAPWVTGFSDVSGGAAAALATWQGATGQDANSTSDPTGDPNFGDLVSLPANFDIGAGSDAIGLAGDYPWAAVDRNGHLRSLPYDAGADEFGVSTGPTPPSLDGSVTVTPLPAVAAHGTVAPTVELGATSVTPAPAVAAHGTVAPSVSAGGVSITPAPAVAEHGTVAPTVTGGLGITVTPAPAVAAHGTVAPGVELGAVSVAPDPTVAVHSTTLPYVRDGQQRKRKRRGLGLGLRL